MSDNNSILELANMGIAVTSENSRALVHYISDLENLNYDLIPERKSVSRLGYIESEGFSPYVDGLIFDGDATFRHIFETPGMAGAGAFPPAGERDGPDRFSGLLRVRAGEALRIPALFCASLGRGIRHGKDRGLDAGGLRLGEPGDGAVHPDL